MIKPVKKIEFVSDLFDDEIVVVDELNIIRLAKQALSLEPVVAINQYIGCELALNECLKDSKKIIADEYRKIIGSSYGKKLLLSCIELYYLAKTCVNLPEDSIIHSLYAKKASEMDELIEENKEMVKLKKVTCIGGRVL